MACGVIRRQQCGPRLINFTDSCLILLLSTAEGDSLWIILQIDMHLLRVRNGQCWFSMQEKTVFSCAANELVVISGLSGSVNKGDWLSKLVLSTKCSSRKLYVDWLRLEYIRRQVTKSWSGISGESWRLYRPWSGFDGLQQLDLIGYCCVYMSVRVTERAEPTGWASRLSGSGASSEKAIELTESTEICHGLCPMVSLTLSNRSDKSV